MKASRWNFLSFVRFTRGRSLATAATLGAAEAAVSSGHADMIAFGRPFISNPDLVERFAKNIPLAEEASLRFGMGLGGAEGYTDFPVAE